MKEIFAVIIHIVTAVLLLITSLCDIKEKAIPVITPVLIAVAGAVYAVFCDPSAFIRMLVIGIVFFLIACVSRQSIGYGDVAVVTGLALIVDFCSFILLLSTAFFLCGIYSVIMKIKSGEKAEIAFVPFISIGYFLALL